MNINKNIILNTTIRWSAEIMNKSLWFVFMIVLARMLGSKDFGYFSFAFAFASIFAAFTDLGTNTLILKDISRDTLQASSHLSNIFALKMMLSLLVFIAILLYSTFSHSADIILHHRKTNV